MLKKYFPLIALLAAASLFIWIKYNQHTRAKKNYEVISINPPASEPFKRDTAMIVYSKHARCRMECRQINDSEVKQILLQGSINKTRIEENTKGITYPLEGVTQDGQHVRVVVAPHKNEIVVVTVIDLEKEWQCNCN